MNKKIAYALLAFNALLIGTTQASANLMPECERMAAETIQGKFPGYFADGTQILRQLQTIDCVDAWGGRGLGDKACTLTATGEGLMNAKFLVVLTKSLSAKQKLECNAVLTALLLEK